MQAQPLDAQAFADLSDAQLTDLYRQVNNETPPAKPQALTTARIFKAMRGAYAKGKEASAAEVAALTNALHRLDSAIIGTLPTFEVVHEGELDAVVENLVLAVTRAGEQLKASAPPSLPSSSSLPSEAFGLRLYTETAQRLAAACLKIGEALVGGYFGGARYVAGLPVRDAAHAFQVGNRLGLAAGTFGSVTWDVHGYSRTFLVFEDAHVSQA